MEGPSGRGRWGQWRSNSPKNLDLGTRSRLRSRCRGRKSMSDKALDATCHLLCLSCPGEAGCEWQPLAVQSARAERFSEEDLGVD